MSFRYEVSIQTLYNSWCSTGNDLDDLITKILSKGLSPDVIVIKIVPK